MLNVISFHSARGRAGRPGTQRGRVTADTDVSQLASRVAGLQSKAKEDIYQAIFLLDLAAQHARQVGKRLCDPATKRRFEDHISTIEQLLEVARDLARKL